MRRTEVCCAGTSLREEERKSTHKGKKLTMGESIATLMCCGLCLTNLQPAVCRSSCCSVALRLLCSYHMSFPGFIKPSVPW